MLEIKINDVKTTNDLPKATSLDDMIDYVLNNKIKNDQIIFQIILDGEDIDFDKENQLNRSLQENKTINFKIKSTIDVAYESLNDCSLFIDSSIDKIHQIVQLYRENEVQKANLAFPEIIDMIDFFVKLITKIYKTIIGGQENPEKSDLELIQNLEIHLLTVLKSLLPAKEKGDITMLCDLLEYELSDNLQQWKAEIIPTLENMNK